MATQKTTTPQIVPIPIDKIDPSPFNPRKTFIRIDELAASITQQGLRTPVLLRAKKNRFELISGERRWKASQKAKANPPVWDGKNLPAIVTEMTDEQAKEFQLVENLQRDDLHPMEEAEGYEAILQHPDYTIEKLCLRTGKKRRDVEQRLRLLTLITPFRKMFSAGEINADQASQLSRALPETQAEMNKYWDGDIPKASEIAEFLETHVYLDLSKAPFPLDRKDLDVKAGACTDCPKHTGANTALFADIGKNDFCLDGSCFRRKAVSLIQIELKTAKDEKRTLVPVSASNNFLTDEELKKLPPGTLSRADHFTTLAKKDECRHAQEALVVHGDNFGKKIHICVAKECPEHGDRHRSTYKGTGEDEKERSERLRKERKEKAAKETRRAVLVHVAKKAENLNLPELQQIGRAIFSRLYNDLQRKMLNVLGWMPQEKKNGQSWDEIFAEHFEPLRGADVNRTLVMLSLATQMEGKPYGDETDRLMEFAERYKVGVKTIEQEIEEKYFPTRKDGQAKLDAAKPDQSKAKPEAPKGKKKAAAK
ncbi:MAG TPA: ParB/RepB/Spo0J family partition protein [Candidatus Angelobacter sp.]|nr:ParB/RepB/Spo0J family partition protein [Candidatus Angelobacter sp.]